VSETSSYDRGLWPARFSRHEIVSLSIQSKHDRRNIPLKWFWRLLNIEDSGGISPEETYYETPEIYRKYDGPHGVHLFVDDSGKQKGKVRGVVETTGEIVLAISRSECRRLGVQFGTVDDRDATLTDEEKTGHSDGPFKGRDPIYIPRAGDIFMFRRRHHYIQQLEPDYSASLSPQGTVMVWKGTAVVVSMDATKPIVNIDQLVPPTSDPVVPHAHRDVQWLG